MAEQKTIIRIRHKKYTRERKKLQRTLFEIQDIFDEPNLTEERFEYAKKLCAMLRRQIKNHESTYRKARETTR